MLSTPVLALELDLSVDEEIRKNYNPSKLENETLPPLPRVNSTNTGGTTGGTTTTTLPKTLPTGAQTTQGQSSGFQKYPVKTGEYKKKTGIKVRSGQKFTVRSNQAVSSGTRVGARISFSLKYDTPLKRSGYVIPAGTVFHGEIVDSHNPQFTGNGGLLAMMVDSITYNGSTTGIEAKITKAEVRWKSEGVVNNQDGSKIMLPPTYNKKKKNGESRSGSISFGNLHPSPDSSFLF